MANRVVLDPDGLRVSQPGQNVLAAPTEDLSFTSDWSAFGLFAQGTHMISWPVLPLSQREGSYSADISYGITFTTPPLFLVEVNLGGVWRVLGGGTQGGGAYIRREIRIYVGGSWARTAFYTLSVTSTASQLRIRGSFDLGGIQAQNRFQPPDLQIRYSVFTYNF